MKKLVITLLIMGIAISMVSCGEKEAGKETNDNNIVVDIEKDKENSNEEKSPITIQDSNESKEENEQEEKNEVLNEQASKEPNNVNDESVKEEESNQSIEENQSESEEVTRSCRLFFYNGVEDVIYYKDTVVEVIDQAVTKALTNGLKDSAGTNFLVLPSNVEVLSAKLDGDSITVNLSSSYYDFSSGLGSAARNWYVKFFSSYLFI